MSVEIQIKKNSTSGPTLHTTNNITITDVVPTTKELRLLWREVRYGTNIGSLNVYIANPTTGATISNSLYSAAVISYKFMQKIGLEGSHYRKDIGYRSL